MEHNKGSRESSWPHLAPEHILNIPGLTASNTVLRGAEEAVRCWRIGNTFVLASLLSESKRESRKLLGKAGVLSLSLGPVNKVQSIFFPWLTTDLKINENLLLRIAVVPGRGLCLPLRKPEQAESYAAPTRVTIPKERSPFGSEPSGPCQRRKSPKCGFEQMIILALPFFSSLSDPEPILNKAVLRLIWIPVHSALWDP